MELLLIKAYGHISLWVFRIMYRKKAKDRKKAMAAYKEFIQRDDVPECEKMKLRELIDTIDEKMVGFNDVIFELEKELERD